MQITLQEAYEHAQKALPGWRVQVQVSLGNSYSWGLKGIQWSISAEKEGTEGSHDKERVSATDELFAVALAKVVADSKRAVLDPVADVVVDDKAAATRPAPEEGSDPGSDIPF